MNRMFWPTVFSTALWLGAAGATAQTAPARVTITDISVIGNTLVPQAQVDATLAPFKGERTMAELQQAAAALQALYRQAGYGTVVTFLPEQAVAGGKLVIGVLEGRIARVAVLGNRRFSTEAIRRSVPALAEGRTPQMRRIDAQVQLANDNPARKLAITLEAGAQKGDVDAQVQVTESSPSRWLLSADNDGSRQTGRLRLGLGYQNAMLWERDHQLSLQAMTAPEHPSAVRIFSASYRVPVVSAGLLVNLYGTYSSVGAGSTATAAGALVFNGKGRALGLSVTRLLERMGEFEQRVSVALERRDYLNNCAIEGLPEGACGIAGESVSVHPLTAEYTAQRGGERAAGFNVSISHNLALGGRLSDKVDAVRPGGARRYSVLRGGAFASLPLASQWRLDYRVSAQASGDALIPGEQFGLAGSAAVRGYEEREVTGDSGVAGSLELVTPPLGSLGWRALAFADAGNTRNRLGSFCLEGQSSCSLASVGLGARFALGALQGRLDLAHALDDARSTQRGATRLHFQASIALE